MEKEYYYKRELQFKKNTRNEINEINFLRKKKRTSCNRCDRIAVDVATE